MLKRRPNTSLIFAKVRLKLYGRWQQQLAPGPQYQEIGEGGGQGDYDYCVASLELTGPPPLPPRHHQLEPQQQETCQTFPRHGGISDNK